MAAKVKTTDRVRKALAPVAENLGLEIWDVESVKEGPDMILRVYVDREGGVSIDECEAMSRASDPILDEMDLYGSQYVFEVSSPGIERVLRTDDHLRRYIGGTVTVRLIRPDKSGRKELRGVLESFDGKTVTISTDDGDEEIPRGDTAVIQVYEDFMGDIR